MDADEAWDQMEKVRRQRWQQSVGQRETPGDLVQRLRDRAYSGLPDRLSEQAADEIERLRASLDELRSAADQADAEYCAEIARLRLTDEEREAVRFFSQIDGPHNVPVANQRAATLRGLLERLSR